MIKRLADMTDADWLTWRWIEVTRMEDAERHFLRGHELTPEERADMRETLARAAY